MPVKEKLPPKADKPLRFIMTSTLPANMLDEERELLEQWGIRFIEQEAFTENGDYVFVPVQLPDGWRLEWNGWCRVAALEDERGRERALIYFKPDPWQGWAYLRLVRRFASRADERSYGKSGAMGALVTDCGEVVHTTQPVRQKKEETLYCQYLKRVISAGEQWLDQRYPGWRDPAAYWD